MAVVLLSLYVLFTPRTGGEALFYGSDKVVHLVLFALLAAAVRWRCGPALTGALLVVAYAAASEGVQAVALATRSGDVRDLVADLVGAALGWGLARRALRAREPALS